MRRAIDRYVESLLRRRRPKPFAAAEDDIAVARAAIGLAAAAPDAQRPREAFVEELRRKLAAQQDVADPAPRPPAAHTPRARRRVLAATAATATGFAAVVAVDRLVIGPASPAEAGGGELTSDAGRWQTVAAAADLPEGAVLPFDLGAVNGFVRKVSGRVQAVSGVCTHQGCRLRLDPPREQLACPCHGATFTLAGAPLTRPHGSSPLPALPRLPVRVDAGNVQVYAPASDRLPGAGTPANPHNGVSGD